MTVSNRLGAAVRPVRPAPETGWVVKVHDWSGTVVAIVPFVEVSFSLEMNDKGGGSVTIDLDHEFLQDATTRTAVMERTYRWAAYEDEKLRACWLPDKVDTDVISENLERPCVISGPGISHVLDMFSILPPKFPGGNPTGKKDTATGRVMASWFPSQKIGSVVYSYTKMQLWLQIFRDTKAYRGALPGAEPLAYIKPLVFDSVHDSKGLPWADLGSVTDAEGVNPDGRTLFTHLVDCTQSTGTDFYVHPNGYIDVQQNLTRSDGTITSYFGTHLQTAVTFWVTSTQTKKRERDRSTVENVVYVREDDGAITYNVRSDSIVKWKRRERLLNLAGLGHPALRKSMADKELKFAADESDAQILKVPPYVLMDDGAPVNQVFADYGVGDWVGVAADEPDGTTANSLYRVDAITVRIDQDSNYDVELTLNSSQDLARKRQAALDQQGGGSGYSGNDGAGTGVVLFYEDLYDVPGTVPKSFATTYLPTEWSEHVSLGKYSDSYPDTSLKASKLRRAKHWTRKKYNVKIKNPHGAVHDGDPWWLSVQYAHQGEKPAGSEQPFYPDDYPAAPANPYNVTPSGGPAYRFGEWLTPLTVTFPYDGDVLNDTGADLLTNNIVRGDALFIEASNVAADIAIAATYDFDPPPGAGWSLVSPAIIDSATAHVHAKDMAVQTAYAAKPPEAVEDTPNWETAQGFDSGGTSGSWPSIYQTWFGSYPRMEPVADNTVLHVLDNYPFSWWHGSFHSSIWADSFYITPDHIEESGTYPIDLSWDDELQGDLLIRGYQTGIAYFEPSPSNGDLIPYAHTYVMCQFVSPRYRWPTFLGWDGTGEPAFEGGDEYPPDALDFEIQYLGMSYDYFVDSGWDWYSGHNATVSIDNVFFEIADAAPTSPVLVEAVNPNGDVYVVRTLEIADADASYTYTGEGSRTIYGYEWDLNSEDPAADCELGSPTSVTNTTRANDGSGTHIKATSSSGYGVYTFRVSYEGTSGERWVQDLQANDSPQGWNKKLHGPYPPY